MVGLPPSCVPHPKQGLPTLESLLEEVQTLGLQAVPSSLPFTSSVPVWPSKGPKGPTPFPCHGPEFHTRVSELDSRWITHRQIAFCFIFILLLVFLVLSIYTLPPRLVHFIRISFTYTRTPGIQWVFSLLECLYASSQMSDIFPL